jgi:hypothetical protein
MSVKAQALVWDLECPKKYGELMFKPSHKYVLIAYADHADHHGKNIWPAVLTISNKTGLDERSVQRLTHDLEEIGLLVDDGIGPRGTNKWMLPYSEGGDKLTPLTICRGDKKTESLGDIPSGDIPSGDKLTPEFKEPEPLNTDSEDKTPASVLWEKIYSVIEPDLKGNSRIFVKGVQPVRFADGILTLRACDETTRDYLQDRFTSTINRLLIGVLDSDTAGVEFIAEAA